MDQALSDPGLRFSALLELHRESTGGILEAALELALMSAADKPGNAAALLQEFARRTDCPLERDLASLSEEDEAPFLLNSTIAQADLSNLSPTLQALSVFKSRSLTSSLCMKKH